jgi:hypothetical protein
MAFSGNACIGVIQQKVWHSVFPKIQKERIGVIQPDSIEWTAYPYRPMFHEEFDTDE